MVGWQRFTPWRRWHWPWLPDPVMERKMDRIICVLEHLNQKETLTMSVLSNLISDVKAELALVLDRVKEDVTNYEERIAQLQAQVDQGVATPQDLADLADIKAQLAALDPTNPNVLPTEPVVP